MSFVHKEDKLDEMYQKGYLKERLETRDDIRRIWMNAVEKALKGVEPLLKKNLEKLRDSYAKTFDMAIEKSVDSFEVNQILRKARAIKEFMDLVGQNYSITDGWKLVNEIAPGAENILEFDVWVEEYIKKNGKSKLASIFKKEILKQIKYVM